MSESDGLDGRLELLNDWLDRYRRHMVSAAIPFAGGGTAADDIVQLASLEALSRVEDLTTIGAPAAWLAGVARNVGLRVYRKRNRRARLRKKWARNEDERLADAHRRIVLSWSVDGIDSRRERVLEAAQELSEPLREVVVAMLDDMSDEEIATHCEVSVSTVRVRRHRAIRAVQQVFRRGGNTFGWITQPFDVDPPDCMRAALPSTFPRVVARLLAWAVHAKLRSHSSLASASSRA